jgi:hypothetical protein
MFRLYSIASAMSAKSGRLWGGAGRAPVRTPTRTGIIEGLKQEAVVTNVTKIMMRFIKVPKPAARTARTTEVVLESLRPFFFHSPLAITTVPGRNISRNYYVQRYDVIIDNSNYLYLVDPDHDAHWRQRQLSRHCLNL